MPSRFVPDHSNIDYDRLSPTDKKAFREETLGLLKVPAGNELAGMFNDGAGAHPFYAQPPAPPVDRRGAITWENPHLTPTAHNWGNDF